MTDTIEVSQLKLLLASAQREVELWQDATVGYIDMLREAKDERNVQCARLVEALLKVQEIGIAVNVASDYERKRRMTETASLVIYTNTAKITAEWLREQKREAWEEGRNTGVLDGRSVEWIKSPNPYIGAGDPL